MEGIMVLKDNEKDGLPPKLILKRKLGWMCITDVPMDNGIKIDGGRSTLPSFRWIIEGNLEWMTSRESRYPRIPPEWRERIVRILG